MKIILHKINIKSINNKYFNKIYNNKNKIQDHLLHSIKME